MCLLLLELFYLTIKSKGPGLGYVSSERHPAMLSYSQSPPSGHKRESQTFHLWRKCVIMQTQPNRKLQHSASGSFEFNERISVDLALIALGGSQWILPTKPGKLSFGLRATPREPLVSKIKARDLIKLSFPKCVRTGFKKSK